MNAALISTENQTRDTGQVDSSDEETNHSRVIRLHHGHQKMQSDSNTITKKFTRCQPSSTPPSVKGNRGIVKSHRKAREPATPRKGEATEHNPENNSPRQIIQGTSLESHLRRANQFSRFHLPKPSDTKGVPRRKLYLENSCPWRSMAVVLQPRCLPTRK